MGDSNAQNPDPTELRRQIANIIGFLHGIKGEDINKDSVVGQSINELVELYKTSMEAALTKRPYNQKQLKRHRLPLMYSKIYRFLLLGSNSRCRLPTCLRTARRPAMGDSNAQKPDIKLVRALQADFKVLYQPEYTTDYQTKRMLINIELGIMQLTNLEKYIEGETS